MEDNQTPHDISTLSRIKLQLSVEQFDHESTNAINTLYNKLDNLDKTNQLYIATFKSNTEKEILKNSDLINKLFVTFIKELPTKTYKFEMIFIVFCDYYDFPYNKVFIKLHVKIQKLLETCLKRIIGKSRFTKNYNKHILGVQPGDDIHITKVTD